MLFPHLLGSHGVPCLCEVGMLRSWEAHCGEVRAGWQDPSLRGQWPWREMKEVHVRTLAAQTGLQSSVKALLPIHPCCFSPAPLLHPSFFDFRWGGGGSLVFQLFFPPTHSSRLSYFLPAASQNFFFFFFCYSTWNWEADFVVTKNCVNFLFVSVLKSRNTDYSFQHCLPTKMFLMFLMFFNAVFSYFCCALSCVLHK